MKSPDEIKKALECCFYESAQCGECPYYPVSCDRELVRDAREYIRQLEERNKSLRENNDNLLALDGELHRDFLEQRERADRLEAERDAAIADMTEMAKYGGENCCEWCDQTECECTCADVGIYAGFNWRGVQKEDSDA